jgi:hypothetical protein
MLKESSTFEYLFEKEKETEVLLRCVSECTRERGTLNTGLNLTSSSTLLLGSAVLGLLSHDTTTPDLAGVLKLLVDCT